MPFSLFDLSVEWNRLRFGSSFGNTRHLAFTVRSGVLILLELISKYIRYFLCESLADPKENSNSFLRMNASFRVPPSSLLYWCQQIALFWWNYENEDMHLIPNFSSANTVVPLSVANSQSLVCLREATELSYLLSSLLRPENAIFFEHDFRLLMQLLFTGCAPHVICLASAKVSVHPDVLSLVSAAPHSKVASCVSSFCELYSAQVIPFSFMNLNALELNIFLARLLPQSFVSVFISASQYLFLRFVNFYVSLAVFFLP